MPQVEKTVGQTLGSILKLYVIASLFTPLLCYCSYLLNARGYQFDLLSLALGEQALILALLLLPVFSLKHLGLYSRPETPPHPME